MTPTTVLPGYEADEMTDWSSRVRGWTSVVSGAWIALSSGIAAAQPTVPEPPPPLPPWTEALDLGVFADTYASLNFNLPKVSEGANGLRAYDTSTGFALAWAGADVSYTPAPVGGALSLRFGPAAERYADACFGDGLSRCDGDVPGLGFVKQAYASWAPRPGLRFDLGKFDTPFGAEVAESQDNLLYSRGAVYWLAQPLFHTGLSATATLLPWLTARGLVANGWNNTLDNNAGKSFGVQAILAPTPTLRVALGWLGGPEQTDFAVVNCEPGEAYNVEFGACWPLPAAPGGTETVDRGGANDFEAWRHLIDLVATWQPTPRLAVVLNVDYGQEGVRRDREIGEIVGPDGALITGLWPEVSRQHYFGSSLAAHFALNDSWAVAGRGEYFTDPDGLASEAPGLELVTATLGLELSPSPALLLRLEGRGDFAVAADGGRELFVASSRGAESSQLTATLGVVVRTF